MNNNEIRLSILIQYYRAMFNGKVYGKREENEELEGISSGVINANMIYLIDKQLINGSKQYYNKGIGVTSVDITALGMDIVEEIMDKSLEKIDQTHAAEIQMESQTDKKLDKFYEKCIKIAPMCETVVRIAGAIFSAL